MRLVVTGATGYIGERFVAKARQRGWRVTAATRAAPRMEGVDWIPYALEDDRASNLPEGAVIVHLAANTRASDPDADIELRALGHLLKGVARDSASRLLFLSSQAASPNAPTVYGRAKWQAEREVLAGGGTIIRAGLVYGGPPRGLFGTLTRIARRLPVLPALVPTAFVQPIHVDDLAEALCRIIECPDANLRQWYLGAEAPTSFTTFLHALARHRLRRRRAFVPVPVAMLIAAHRLSPSRIREFVDIGRLRSLTRTEPMATASSLAQLRLALRGLEDGMEPSGCARRRQLAREARALLRYVLGQAAPNGCIRRYVRAIERLRDGEPLRLPATMWRCPSLIALIERAEASQHSAELTWRIDAATLIAEASPTGARQFLLLEDGRRLQSALVIVRALAVELGVRLVRPIAARVVRDRATVIRDR